MPRGPKGEQRPADVIGNAVNSMDRDGGGCMIDATLPVPGKGVRTKSGRPWRD